MQDFSQFEIPQPLLRRLFDDRIPEMDKLKLIYNYTNKTGRGLPLQIQEFLPPTLRESLPVMNNLQEIINRNQWDQDYAYSSRF